LNDTKAVILRYVTEFGRFGVDYVKVVEIKSLMSATTADQLPLPMIVKRGWSGFVPVRRAI